MKIFDEMFSMFVDVHFWTTVILIKIPMDFLNSKHIELLFTVGLKAEFAVNFVTSTILLNFSEMTGIKLASARYVSPNVTSELSSSS